MSFHELGFDTWVPSRGKGWYYTAVVAGWHSSAARESFTKHCLGSEQADFTSKWLLLPFRVSLEEWNANLCVFKVS